MAKKELEALVKAGAFDFLDKDRGSMMAAIPAEIRRGKNWNVIATKGAWSLDADAGLDDAIPVLDNWPAERWSKEQIAAGEDETLEFYFSGHPLQEILTKYLATIEHTTKSIIGKPDKTKVIMGGILRRVKIIPIKSGRFRGKKMARYTLEDTHGRVNMVTFSDDLESCEGYITDGARVVVYGQTSSRSGVTEVISRKFETFEECLGRSINGIRMVFDLETIDLPNLSSVLRKQSGSVPLFLHGKTPSSSVIWRTPFQVALNDEFLSAAEQLAGVGCLRRDLLLA